jgi:hypothetical protein
VAPLQQLNLKLPAEVLDHWRGQAAAEGLSVRDWLVTIAGPSPAPGAGAGLAERVAELEHTAADLREALAALRASPVAPPAPRPSRPSAPPLPSAAAGAGALTTAELASRYGVNRASFNNWAATHPIGSVRTHRQTGPWRLVGKTPVGAGGPPRWLWEPAGEA